MDVSIPIDALEIQLAIGFKADFSLCVFSNHFFIFLPVASSNSLSVHPSQRCEHPSQRCETVWFPRAFCCYSLRFPWSPSHLFISLVYSPYFSSWERVWVPTREHGTICSIENSVGHIARICSCCSGLDCYWFKYLSGAYTRLSTDIIADNCHLLHQNTFWG